MSVLSELVAERGHLILDGAMGTELFARGLPVGESPERWNLDEPDRVTAVHADYIAAGSDVVLTNSFGGTAFRLALHGLDDRVEVVNHAGALAARSAADGADRRVLVAGSMGPTGELLEPLGTMTMDECAKAFAAQASGLADGGVDVLWIETMSHLDEVTAAVEGARSASDLPIVVTMSFDTAGRTMMGVTGTAAATRLVELGVGAMGANCGNNLADTEAAVVAIGAAAGGALVVSKANAGVPEWRGAGLHYSGSPDVMAAHAVRMRDAGAHLVGACCGSTPAHITAIRATLAT